jgi:hypothetical protein
MKKGRKNLKQFGGRIFDANLFNVSKLTSRRLILDFVLQIAVKK